MSVPSTSAIRFGSFEVGVRSGELRWRGSKVNLQGQPFQALMPDYPNALWFLALSLEQKGKLSEAVAALEKAASLSAGSHYRALVGRAYALVGERTKALDIADELRALSRRMYVSPYDIAMVYMGLGDRTPAFQYLEKACQERVFRIIELTMPIFDAVRSDPRWQDLVSRIGLPR